MLVTLSGWLPAAVNVTDFIPLVVPTPWLPKLSAPGPKATPGKFAVPILATKAFALPSKLAWTGLAVGKLLDSVIPAR
jgi:hypothetical protein